MESTRINLTDSPLTTWGHDKNIDFQKNNLAKKIEVK